MPQPNIAARFREAPELFQLFLLYLPASGIVLVFVTFVWPALFQLAVLLLLIGLLVLLCYYILRPHDLPPDPRPAPRPPPLFKNRWAVVIGVATYDSDNITNLHCSQNDAGVLAATLEKQLGFEPERVRVFHDDTDSKPHRSTILEALADLKDGGEVTAEDLVVFFFSGHGLMGDDGKDYLLPSDCAPQDLTETGLRVELVADRLEQLKCNNVVMLLDACREHVLEGGKSVARIGENAARAVRKKGIVTFFSCDAKRRSYEIAELMHGTFTYCLLDAIKDSQCHTVKDLEAHLQTNVPIINKKHKRESQSPYAVIKGAAKADLPILMGAPGAGVADSYEGLMDILEERLTSEAIDLEQFSKATDLLVRLAEGTGSAHDEQYVPLLERWAQGAMEGETLRRGWLALEKRQRGVSPIRQKL